ncbi:PLP-dependent aminotransferase family protein [Photobacterium minamisatsumaniensis]|uniref:aminotransferase-like domain-containing protein n=1 Tax=Photobacterium minamisatsumaniensis TaxID=2910233 RepID=UPI003D10B1BA
MLKENIIARAKHHQSSHQQAKYQQVVTLIGERIDKRSYQAGDKLPSIRELSAELSLSKNTIIRAYQQLEASGKITACSRSGFIVSAITLPVKKITTTPKYVDLMALSKTIMKLPAEDNIVSFGSAHPDTDFPAIRSLYAEIGRHSRYQHHIPSHYQLPPGNEDLLKQLVAVNRELGINTSVNELLITNGAQQAISLSLQAITQPGDIVLVESPSYFGNLLLLESLGLKAIEVPALNHEGMDLNALQQVLARWPVRAIITNPSFNNPTGFLMPTNKRLEFLAITSGIPIIEDDVFGGLAYQSRPLPLKTLDTENRIIYCNSLSKTLDSRLRIGWVIAGKYQTTIEKRLMTDNMGSPNLMHSAVGQFLSTGKYRQHLGKIRRSYAKKQKMFYQQLTQALDQYPNLYNHYHLSQPQGGFLCWLTLPNSVDGLALYRSALEKGISILPGEMFSSDKHHRNCLRLSFATFEPTQKWKNALETLAEVIARHDN